MGKTKAKRKKRRRRGAPSAKKKGGVLLGMRSGFKNVAHSVTGVGEEQPAKKSSVLGTLVTILLVAAAAALLFKRFH